MSTTQTFNNASYTIPTQGDPAPWAPSLDRYLVALGTYAFSPAGGSYPLTANLNLGSSFGLVAPYYTTATASPASAGVLRLAKTDNVEWRNHNNNGNNLLGVNTSDELTFNGVVLQTTLGSLPDGQIWIGNISSVPTPQTISGAITTTDAGVTAISSDYITNSMVNSAAAIAYSKLNLLGSIVNADIYSSAAIAYSKLALTGSIVNADVNASAAIAYSKLNLTGSILNADIASGAAIAVNKFAALTISSPVRTNGSGFLTTGATDLSTSDVTGNLGVSHLNSGTSASSSTFWRGDGTWAAPASGGTVNSGTAGNLSLYATTTNAVSDTYVQNTKNITLGIAAQASRSANLAITIPNPGNAVTTANVVLDQGATTLAGALTSTGGITMSGAVIAMGAQKITGLAAATANGDAVRFEQISGFRVLQVVTASTTSTTTTSSGSFVDTALSASITPASSSSKILVMSFNNLQAASTSGAIIIHQRAGTTTLTSTGETALASGTGTVRGTSTLIDYDSPATASAVTYKVQLKSNGGGSVIHTNVGTSTLFLLELG